MAPTWFANAERRRINLRRLGPTSLGIAIDETTTMRDLGFYP